jgi:NADPH:quinone reductase
VLDLLGGDYTGASVAVAAPGGRIMLVGTLAGGRATVSLGSVLARRLTLRGTVLRSRSSVEKAEATRRFGEDILPLLAAGRLRPVIDRVLPLDQVEEAYAHVAEDRAVGKVVLAIGRGT